MLYQQQMGEDFVNFAAMHYRRSGCIVEDGEGGGGASLHTLKSSTLYTSGNPARLPTSLHSVTQQGSRIRQDSNMVKENTLHLKGLLHEIFMVICWLE
jgi:hypothetical protein